MKVELNNSSSGMDVFKIEDNPVTEMNCDWFLSQFKEEEIPKVVETLLSKVRIGGTACFQELDVFNFGKHVNSIRINPSQVYIPNGDLCGNKITSFLSLEYLTKLIPDHFIVTTSMFVRGKGQFQLKVKRVK
jgi:hypothetical protein